MIRPVERADLGAVVELVHDLAAYEREPEACHLSIEALERALFAGSPALFGHVAEHEGRVVGIALWFLNFSTWEGVHGIHLEDFYVRPELRGGGHGRALLAALAATCVEHGWNRLEFSVLDWNEPALRVYRALGAEPMDEWTVHRIAGESLVALAGEPVG